MRPLFVSEWKCVSVLTEMQWNRAPSSEPEVFDEYHALDRCGSASGSFNCDFIMDFVNPKLASWKHTTTMQPILPNTLGADLFLVTGETSLAPMRLQLIGGPAFSKKYFKRFVNEIESLLQRVGIQSAFSGMLSELVLKNITATIRKAVFSRVLVVGDYTTFLYFPKHRTPIYIGNRINVVCQEDCVVDLFVDGDELIAVDGWLRHDQSPREGDWYLVATPQEGDETIQP